MKKKHRIELLIPVGAMSKLMTAIEYGADAVYLSGLDYGLRQAADNFNNNQLRAASQICQNHKVKLFIVINSYFHDNDFNKFPEYIKFLNTLKIDALIVSDLGVIKTLKDLTNIPIHLSTQASCLNLHSAKFWKKQGVSRIVLGREVSIIDASRIKKEISIEVEQFVHGSMCMAFSGQCTISNFTQGRDSNRGGCAHSCRFNYSIHNDSTLISDYFMSSKDLNGIELIPQLIEAEIDSLKVEGRMKTVHYVSTVAKIYREAIDYYYDHGLIKWSQKLKAWTDELNKINHRDYFQGNLLEKKIQPETYQERENEKGEMQVVGKVVDVSKENGIILQASHKFNSKDTLEFISFKGEPIRLELINMCTVLNEQMEVSKPGQLIKIKYLPNISVNNIIRKI